MWSPLKFQFKWLIIRKLRKNIMAGSEMLDANVYGENSENGENDICLW